MLTLWEIGGLLWLALLLPTALWAGPATSAECANGVVQMGSRTGAVVDKSRPDHFEVVDEFDSRFFVRADLDGARALTMSFNTKVVDEDGNVLRSEIRAAEQFKRAMAHFEGRYRAVRLTFTKPWAEDTLPMADVINHINDQTGRGESLRSAIWSSPFGRMAKENGLTHMASPEVLEGGPGDYDTVVVEFSARPPSLRMRP